MTSSRLFHITLSTVATVAIAVAATACGGDADTTGLSEQAARGKQISISNGCASCHGTDGQGGVGPGWEGLAGSEVELEDGSTVVADDAYLIRAIMDPAAEIRPGYSLRMPVNNLPEADVLDIVAFINELAAPAD